MITEFFLNLIYGVVGIILTPIQIVFEPLGDMSGFLELLASASIFIPLYSFGICLTIWFTYYLIQFAVVLMNWIIAKIPTID